MNDYLLHPNLVQLGKKIPSLAQLIKNTPTSGKFRVSTSKTKAPFLTYHPDPATSKTLHSAYDPVKEARRLIQSIDTHSVNTFVLLGAGLGYSALELFKSFPSNSRMILVESHPEILRLAFMHHDFTALLRHPGIQFHAGIPADKFADYYADQKLEWALNGIRTISFPPVAEISSSYFKSIETEIARKVSEGRLELETQSELSKLFYSNILENFSSALNDPGITPLKNLYKGTPGIIISAGPSLDRNIALLRHAAGNVPLIAVATALNPLIENGIHPDFVVAIDPDDSMVKAFDLETIPGQTRLLYDPGIPPSIVEKFPQKRIVVDSNVEVYRWLSQDSTAKGSLGEVQSVAHAAYQFAVHLGCDPIILVGQDLAFHNHRMHCTHSYFQRDQMNQLKKAVILAQLNKEKFAGYSVHLRSSQDIAEHETFTTVAMNHFRNRFAQTVSTGPTTLNATEGGLPIANAENGPLRQFLYQFPSHRNAPHPQELDEFVSETCNANELVSSIQSKLTKIETLTSSLRQVEEKTDPDAFVKEMQSWVERFLEDTETVKLVQGYAYREFTQWNRESNDIERRLSLRTPEETLERKYERDRSFVPALLEAFRFLEEALGQLENTLRG